MEENVRLVVINIKHMVYQAIGHQIQRIIGNGVHILLVLINITKIVIVEDLIHVLLKRYVVHAELVMELRRM